MYKNNVVQQKMRLIFLCIVGFIACWIVDICSMQNNTWEDLKAAENFFHKISGLTVAHAANKFAEPLPEMHYDLTKRMREYKQKLSMGTETEKKLFEVMRQAGGKNVSDIQASIVKVFMGESVSEWIIKESVNMKICDVSDWAHLRQKYSKNLKIDKIDGQEYIVANWFWNSHKWRLKKERFLNLSYSYMKIIAHFSSKGSSKGYINNEHDLHDFNELKNLFDEEDYFPLALMSFNNKQSVSVNKNVIQGLTNYFPYFVVPFFAIWYLHTLTLCELQWKSGNKMSFEYFFNEIILTVFYAAIALPVAIIVGSNGKDTIAKSVVASIIGYFTAYGVSGLSALIPFEKIPGGISGSIVMLVCMSVLITIVSEKLYPELHCETITFKNVNEYLKRVQSGKIIIIPQKE